MCLPYPDGRGFDSLLDYKMEFKDVKTKVKEKFIFVDPVLNAFEQALDMKQNIILTGPRGHGKSEMSKMTLSLAFEGSPFILPFGQGTRQEQVFGAYDMNEWRDNSKLRYMTQEGFMSSTAGTIFEEMLDGNPQLLETLKDPIMRRELCNGSLCIKSDCPIVVGCTNYELKEWAERDGFTSESYHAFLDRFAYRVKVEWPAYEAASYQEMMNKQAVKGTWVNELAHTCEEFHKVGFTITPRNCMIASRGYEKYGLKVFENFMGIPPSLYSGMLSNGAKFKATIAARAVLATAEEVLQRAKRKFTLGQAASQADLAKYVNEVKTVEASLKNMHITDETAPTFRDMSHLCDEVIKMAGEAVLRTLK